MGDLLLSSNPIISRFIDEKALNAEQALMPNLRGMGRVRDLQLAANSNASGQVLKTYSDA